LIVAAIFGSKHVLYQMLHSTPFADSSTWSARLEKCRAEASRFLAEMAAEPGVFRLTGIAEPSDYARCFHVFLAHTLKVPQSMPPERLAADIRAAVRLQRRQCGEHYRGKPFRQLLTFSLSALQLLGVLDDDPLADLVEEQLPVSVREELDRLGCLRGEAGSGNQAMFIAIFLLHGRNHLGLATQPLIDEWVEVHIRHLNRFGFWGPDAGMTHLQFQNGYHQHEMLEYLGVENPRLEQTLEAVRRLADTQGHFAPYPGGGGCYDYDAVFMLTPEGNVPDADTRALLLRTATSIASEQGQDGGFSESLCVRPRTLGNLRMFMLHTLSGIGKGKGPLFVERLRYGLTLQRPKHNRIHTHWSRYSRRWDESDLWDSWFRMLALARIDVAMFPEHASDWGFINYPGIGYHPSLRAKK
jgi:hypothetical protein